MRQSEDAQPNLPSIIPGEKKHKPLCQYPNCEFFAYTLIITGVGQLERSGLYLCRKHRQDYMKMLIHEIEMVRWQPRRHGHLRHHTPQTPNFIGSRS